MPAPERPVLMIDMGGVFFSYSFTGALAAWARAAGTDPEELGRRWRIDEPFDAFERGEITPGAYLGHLRRLLQIQLDDTALAAGWNAIYGHVDAALVELLADPRVRARFGRIVGVSNTNALHAGFWRELYREQLPVLDTLYCSHEFGATKPTAAFFDHVAADCGLARSGLVLVDDIAIVVQSARDLGVPAHQYQDAGELAGFLTAF